MKGRWRDSGDGPTSKLTWPFGSRLAHPSFKKYISLISRLKNGITIWRENQRVKGVKMKMRKWGLMRPWALPFLCYCWRSESDGRPPAGRSCSCKSFQWDPSDAVRANDISINVSWPHFCFWIGQVSGWNLPRGWRTWQFWLSPRSSLDVTQDSCSSQLCRDDCFINNNTSQRRCPHKWQNGNSQMMAIRELKLPMLKHSLATSMKNSITWALCFFFAGFKQVTYFGNYRLQIDSWPRL